MATIRNVTFPKAFCLQLNEVISIYEVKENFFNEDSEHCSKEYQYRCPDNNCATKMTPVNAYSVKKPKQALHFRTVGEHTNCSYQSILDNPNISTQEKTKSINQKLNFQIPNKFVLKKPSITGADNAQGSKISSDEVEPRTVIKNLGHNYNQSSTNVNATSDLEIIVDIFQSPIFTKEYIRANNIRLILPDGISRFFDNCFQHIRWFKEDTTSLIFFDEISKIIPYGKGYKIILKSQLYEVDNDKKIPHQISLYIDKHLIEAYRFRTKFLSNIKDIIENNNEESTTIYFTGTHPKLVDIPNTAYKTYSIEVTNLAYILLVATKDKSTK